MKPAPSWIRHWVTGEDPSREKRIAKAILRHFTDFWNAQSLDKKSKTTRNQYSAALQALGHYLVEQAISEDGRGKEAEQLILDHVGPYDGPLIHQDCECWQNEVDAVSRKLYRFMESTASKKRSR
jgi:hypothetical protein